MRVEQKTFRDSNRITVGCGGLQHREHFHCPVKYCQALAIGVGWVGMAGVKKCRAMIKIMSGVDMGKSCSVASASFRGEFEHRFGDIVGSSGDYGEGSSRLHS